MHHVPPALCGSPHHICRMLWGAPVYLPQTYASILRSWPRATRLRRQDLLEPELLLESLRSLTLYVRTAKQGHPITHLYQDQWHRPCETCWRTWSSRFDSSSQRHCSSCCSSSSSLSPIQVSNYCVCLPRQYPRASFLACSFRKTDHERPHASWRWCASLSLTIAPYYPSG